MVEWVRLSITKECFARMNEVRSSPEIDDDLKKSWSSFILGLLDEVCPKIEQPKQEEVKE